MKLKTLFFDTQSELIKTINDFLYHPVSAIEIDGEIWNNWSVVDEFENNTLTRSIYLMS